MKTIGMILAVLTISFSAMATNYECTDPSGQNKTITVDTEVKIEKGEQYLYISALGKAWFTETLQVIPQVAKYNKNKIVFEEADEIVSDHYTLHLKDKTLTYRYKVASSFFLPKMTQKKVIYSCVEKN